MAEVLKHCTRGVHVFLLLVRLDVRLTREERDVFMTLRNIFGNRYLKDHGIVAVTHGDDFESNLEEEKVDMTFEEWIRQPNLGPLGELFEECDYLCVLFDNSTKAFEIKNRQLENFLTFAEQLRQNGIYTNEHFKKFEPERKKLITELKLPHLKDSIEKKIDTLRLGLSGLSARSALDEVNKIKKDVAKLREEMEHEDDGTFLLQDAKTEVEKIGKKCQDFKTCILIQQLEEAQRMLDERVNVGRNNNGECICL